MDLDVLHTYPVAFVPYRHQNRQTAHLAKRTVISIREVTEAEATPAFLVRGDAGTRFAPKEDGSPRAILSHGGKLWLEAAPAAALAVSFSADALVLGTFLDPCKHLEHRGSCFGPRAKFEPDTRRSTEKRHVREHRQWDDDQGAAMSAKLAARALDAIVVGGTVHVRDYEPLWRVGKERGLCLGTVPRDARERFPKWHHESYGAQGTHELWRADRRAEAETHVRDGIEAIGHTIEVLDPSCLRYNDDGEAMLAALGRAAWSLSYALDTLPRDAVSAFYDVRAALSATRGEFGPAVVGALRRVAALDPDSGDHGTEEPLAKAIMEALAALARWDARPAFRQEWAAGGLPITASLQGGATVRELLDMGATAALGRALSVDMAEWERAAASGEAHLLGVWSDPAGKVNCLGAALVTVGDNPAVSCAMGLGGGEASAAVMAAAAAHARAAGLAVPEVGGALPEEEEEDAEFGGVEYGGFYDEGEGLDEDGGLVEGGEGIAP